MTTHTLHYHRLLRRELRDVHGAIMAGFDGIPETIGRAMALLVNGGGKRLRPAVVLLGAGMAGAAGEPVTLAAAGVEMLHTATLVHDDLIDGARIRRGVETLNVAWSPIATVLTGDAMFALAAKLIAQTTDTTLSIRFAETLESICAGELGQMLSRDGHVPSLAEYLERIYAKTASLFALCAETGPLLAGLDPEAIDDARAFGRGLGEAFQITDDVLDIMGDAGTLGKPVGSDLRQGLATLPVILYHGAHPGDERLLAALHRGADTDTLDALIDDIRASDVAEAAMAVATERIDAVLPLLDRYPTGDHKAALQEIAGFAVRRRH